jgi:hypothetical protein
MPFEPYAARGSKRTIGKCSIGHYNSKKVEQTLISVSLNLMKKLIGKETGRVDLDVDRKSFRIAIHAGDSLAANIPSKTAKRAVITLGKLGYLLKPHEALPAKVEYVEKCAEIEGRPNVLIITIPKQLRKGWWQNKGKAKAVSKPAAVKPILSTKPATNSKTPVSKHINSKSVTKNFESRTSH